MKGWKARAAYPFFYVAIMARLLLVELPRAMYKARSERNK